jgi:pimeloyl-ACP methyl ester carboxylesterase
MPTTPALDDAPLTWHANGDGPALVFTNGIATSTFYWDQLRARLRGRARVVTWDLPGHGDSAPAQREHAVSIPALAEDLRRVMDAAEVEKATLLAFSMGCQVVLEAWRLMPERISAIVPILGSYGRIFDNFIHPAVGPRVLRALRTMPAPAAGAVLKSGARLTRLPGAHRLSQLAGQIGSKVPKAQMTPFYRHLGRVDGRTARWMAVQAGEHDAGDLLADIAVPVMVVAGGRDAFTPPQLARHVAQTAPHGELLELPNATHTGLYDEAEVLNPAVEAFLDRHGLIGPRPGPR